MLLASTVAADAGRGASVAWADYEAEDAKTNAVVVGPDFTGHTAAREASGRRYVRLDKPGSYLEVAAPAGVRGLVVRYSLPDSADGSGLDATLTLTVNDGPPVSLALNSKYSHLYGDYPFKNDPSAGTPRNFWDEARLLLPNPLRAGDVIRLEKTDSDRAAEYAIDFVELETVPPPVQRPAEAIDITDLGAVADDANDDRPALMTAIAGAKAQRRAVWIPAGRFFIGGPVDVSDVTLRGAGMWHTTLIGADDYAPGRRITINGAGSNVTLSDFAIIGRLNYRDDHEPNDGIGGSFGTGSVLRNLWIEHTKTGAWLTNSDGLVVEGCRFRNNIADGINLCLGMRNTIVRNCTARGTGDDCFAMWPATYAKAAYEHGRNRFERCTAQLPFLAQGFSIYGGDGNGVSECVASDIPYGAGLFASTTFPTDDGFRGNTTFRDCLLVRAGDREGAIGTVANRIDLVGVRFRDIEIVDSPNDAVRFMSVHGRALRDAELESVRIRGVGSAGAGHAVVAADDAVGTISLRHISVDDATAKAAYRNASPHFEVQFGEGAEALRPAASTRGSTSDSTIEHRHE